MSALDRLRALRSDKPWLAAAALAALILAVYLPVLPAGYIWDDDWHLTHNACVIGPLGFKEIWTSAEATYYPLVLTTFWLGHKLWGLAPFPFHLLNVLVHAACGVLLWRVLERLRVPGAWLGAAFWSIHPVMVESVAWVTELKNTQSGVFFLISTLSFLRWREERAGADRGRLSYALALLSAAAAILSKSSTVMLPVVLGLVTWWEDRGWRWSEARPLIPFFLISGAASAWTIWEQKFHAGARGAEWAQSWAERLIIAGRDVWFYLGKLAWPHPLIFIYPRWQVDAGRWSEYLPGLLAVAALFVVWRLRQGAGRATFFAYAYFLVSLFPVLNFFNVYFFRFSFVGDHLQYLASMGPLALAGAGVARIALRDRLRNR